MHELHAGGDDVSHEREQERAEKPEPELSRRLRRTLREFADEIRTSRVRYVGGAVIIPCPGARWPHLTRNGRIHAAFD